MLKDDLAHVRRILTNSETSDTYDFATDIKKRMRKQGLSANALAKRLEIRHTAVGKWLDGEAHPNGKERMKELGMALGMEEAALSSFLLRNKYSRLYSKNPLDAVCKRVLEKCAGSKDIVRSYRAELGRYQIDALALPKRQKSVATAFLSQSLKALDSSDTDFRHWLDEHVAYFDADGKTALPGRNLTRFVLLYIGSSSVNDMYIAEELPDPVRRLLYHIRSGKEYALRSLREKLIVFGMYAGMTDADVDRMLGYARLMPLTKQLNPPPPADTYKSKLDTAIVALMRRAHERCPLYEYAAIKRVIGNIVNVMAEHAIRDETSLPVYGKLKSEYLERLRTLRDPYSMPISEESERFEDCYGNHLSDYVKDMLCLLAYCGDLSEKETAPYMKIISKVAPDL